MGKLRYTVILDEARGQKPLVCSIKPNVHSWQWGGIGGNLKDTHPIPGRTTVLLCHRCTTSLPWVCEQHWDSHQHEHVMMELAK